MCQYLKYMKCEIGTQKAHTNPVSSTILEHVLEWHSRGQQFDPAQLHSSTKRFHEGKTLKKYPFLSFRIFLIYRINSI